MSLLKVEQLSIVRQRERVIDDVTFSLDASKIMGLTGPNGAGKSSLFEALLGFLPALSGRVFKSANLRMAYLAQEIPSRKMLPLTVLDFVKMGTWGAVVDKSAAKIAALSVDEVLKELRLSHLAGELISELSGGEWKRAAVARCLVQAADVYLLDEPFNHLDMESEHRLGELMKKMAHEQGISFFVISHDWHAMDHFFDSVLLLNRKLIAQGTPREVGEIYMNWRDPSHHSWLHQGA